jgi:hypothetical protein
MFGFEKRNEVNPLKQIWRPAKTQYTRRADAAVQPMTGEGAKGTYAHNLNQSALFFAFEGHQSTCAIKLANPNQKSRATLILFRGRVLTCVYGKHGVPHHSYNVNAYHDLRRDLSNPQTQVTAYSLTEEMALASASIFQGFQKKQQPKQALTDFFKDAASDIIEKCRPGCILLKDATKHTRFAFYFSQGKVFAIYSFKDGWLDDPSSIAARQIVEKSSKLFGEAFMLSANTLEKIYDLTFKLSSARDTMADKLRWTTGSSCKNSLLPMDLHATGPNLSDTFKLSPGDNNRDVLKEVAKLYQKHRPTLARSLDPNRPTR